jgi:hypothetical protein
MNDFTKEELKLLGGCVFSKFVSSLEDTSIQHLQSDLKNIRDKIQSMIDNYDKETIMVRGEPRQLSEFLKDE